MKQLDKESWKLIDKYKEVYEYLLKQLVSKVEKGLSERQTRSILAAIEEILYELDEDTYKYCTEILPEYYYYGVNLVDEDVSQINLATISGTGAVLHQKAIKNAVNDTYEDLAKRTKFMSKELKKIIRDSSSEIMQRQIISGESRKSVQKELADELEKQGVHAFIDNAKRKWNISRYSELLIRTKPRILTNEGTIDRLKVYQEEYPTSNQFDFVQISSHGARDWCKYFEGTVWSVSGKSEMYPSVNRLPNGYRTLHPNCRHSFQPFIPKLRGKGKVINSSFLDRSVRSLNKEYYHLIKR